MPYYWNNCRLSLRGQGGKYLHQYNDWFVCDQRHPEQQH